MSVCVSLGCEGTVYVGVCHSAVREPCIWVSLSGEGTVCLGVPLASMCLSECVCTVSLQTLIARKNQPCSQGRSGLHYKLFPGPLSTHHLR